MGAVRPSNENSKKSGLSAEKQWRVQVGNQGMAVRNTAQDLLTVGTIKRMRQAQADCFYVSGRGPRLEGARPVTSDQQHDGQRAEA